MEDAVLLLSPNRRQYLMDWLDRYIFCRPGAMTDVTSDTATFSLIGPESDALLDQLGAGAIGQPLPLTSWCRWEVVKFVLP